MTITIFGLLLLGGFIISGFFLWKRAIEEHFAEREVFDIYVVAALWAILAARIVTVALRFDQFGWNPLRWVSLFSLPGLNGTAALVVGTLMVLLAALKRNWSAWLTLDMFLPSVLLWQVSAVAMFNWMVGLYWGLWFCLLLWVEREYRLWDWYRGRRGSARPGLVSALWLVGVGAGFLWFARVGEDMIFLGVVGALVLIGGLFAGYIQSGRTLKADAMSLLNFILGIGKKNQKTQI